MDQDVSKYNAGRKLKINLYVKLCNNCLEVESIIRKMKKNNNDTLNHFSVLGKVSGHSEQDFASSTASLTKVFPMGINFLSIPEVGKVFVMGSLSSLLLEKIDGKALGSLEGGLVGILNGCGVSNKKSLQCIEHLKNGKHIVVAWEYIQEMKRGSKANRTMSPQKE